MWWATCWFWVPSSWRLIGDEFGVRSQSASDIISANADEFQTNQTRKLCLTHSRLYEPAGCRQPVNDLVTANMNNPSPFFLLSVVKLALTRHPKKSQKRGHFKLGIKSKRKIDGIPRGRNWFLSVYGDNGWLSSHVMLCHVSGSGAHDRRLLPIAIFFSRIFCFTTAFPWTRRLSGLDHERVLWQTRNISWHTILAELPLTFWNGKIYQQKRYFFISPLILFFYDESICRPSPRLSWG